MTRNNIFAKIMPVVMGAAVVAAMTAGISRTAFAYEDNGNTYEWRVGEDGKNYWYENGVKQGTYDDAQGVMGDGTIRGREIYDRESDGWYWLDSVYDGAKATGKEVWMPYIYQDEAAWDDAQKAEVAAESDDGMGDVVLSAINGKAGKWVRYDKDGKMLKGWVTIDGELAEIYPEQAGNQYYYDHRTGLMAKGTVTIDGKTWHFDEKTGVLERDANAKAAEDTLLEKVYQSLSAGNYQDIRDIDGSEGAEAVVDAMTGDRILYAPEGAANDFTGTVAGLYKTGNSGYYFYYGGLVDGKRKGRGVSTWITSGGEVLEVFDGEWDNDAPNGHGTDTEYMGDTSSVVEGTYRDGLQDGVFTWSTYADHVNSWTAVNGDAPMVDLTPYQSDENLWAYEWYMKPRALDYDYVIYTAGITADTDFDILHFLSYNPQVEYLGAPGFRTR